MRLSIAFLLIFLMVTISSAQDCKSILLGEIVDFHDNTPLADAIVQVTGKNLSTRSDKSGKFNFKTLCNGIIELEISHPHCKTQFVSITIYGDTYQKISLEHHLEELDEVKVIGDGNKNTNSSQEEKLTQNDLEKFSGRSLGDALKNITGVSSLNTGANIVKPVIQGLNGSRVLILNNNVRMQDMEWGDEHAPNIDINANQDISVIKGSAALEYGGDAIGGVIVLNPLPIVRTDSLFGKTQINLFSNGGGGNLTTSLVKSHASGFYLKAQGSFKYLGDLEAPDYVLSNTGLREKALSINMGKRDFKQGWETYYSFFDSEIAILRASHIGSVDDLIFAINNTEPSIINDFTYNIINPKQEVTHHLAKFNYYKRFKASGKLNLQYDYQRNNRLEYDIRRGDNADRASLDLLLQTHTVSPTFEFDAKKDFHLKFGTLARFQNNFADPTTKVKRLIPDYDKFDFGLFAIGEHKLNDRWEIDGGMRYDFSKINAKKFYSTSRWEERNYNQDFQELIIEDLGTQLLANPVFDYHNISATAGFQYVFAENQTVRMNYALARRAPNPAELFSDGLHHSAARFELGDLRIKSEVSSKISASYEFKNSEVGITFAPYLNAINDFIVLEPSGVETTIRGAFPVSTYRQTNAQIIGVDIGIFKNWTSSIMTDHRFSWVQGSDTSLDLPLINIPATNINNSISYDVEDWHNLVISLNSQYIFKQNRTLEDIFIFSPLEGREVLVPFNSSPAAYHIMGIDFSAQFSLMNENDLAVGLGITNLLNTNYRDYLNRQRYFADDLGRNVNLRIIYKY
jgi:iron complex outermembrane receptor protein